MVDSFATDTDGLLYIVDGLSTPKIWDSLTATTEDAGLAAPLAAATIAVVDAAGDILGEYSAYIRFRDKRGEYSNLSPISNTLTAQRSTTKSISNATNASPIVITTSTTHGLSTGHKVSISGVLGNTAANNTWTVTVLTTSTFSLDDSTGNAAYTSGGTVTIGVTTISYSSVPIATGIGASKVVARELFRNLDGDTSTYYLDATISDNTTTTASSTNNDDELAAQLALPLLLPDDSPNADTHGVPPNWMKCVVHHLGVMFYLVNAEEKRGAVIVTNSSATVTGINTHFTDALVGRFIYVVGATQAYEISAVSEANQTLTLTATYGGTTDQYATFSIKPPPAERRLVYYSVAGHAASVPPTQAISIQEDGTELTGAVTKSSFVFFITERRTYVFTFRSDPAIDGQVYLRGDRGAINQRCIVPVDETIYMLDQSGIHSFNGSESQPVSQMVQGLFSPEGDSNSGLSINWDASEHFHGVHFPAQETVRFFVCMSGSQYPRHALALDYRDGSITIEEYARPISASCTGTVAGARRMYFGSEGKQTFLHGASKLDGIDPASGVLRGTVTSATAATLTDSTASFPYGSLPGLSVTIAEGLGRGQRRTIYAATATTLSLTTPWLIQPDTTSVFQIAGIDWSWRSQWFRYATPSERNVERSIAIRFQPLDEPSPAGLQLFHDYSDEPVEWGYTKAADRSEGFGSTEDSAVLGVNFNRTIGEGNDAVKVGYAQTRMPDNREQNADGPRMVSLELSGTANAETAVLYEVEISGAE